MGTEFQFCKMRVLEMDGGDDYTTTITFNINTQHKYIHGW